jgi:hypothetical protein
LANFELIGAVEELTCAVLLVAVSCVGDLLSARIRPAPFSELRERDLEVFVFSQMREPLTVNK